MGRIFRMIRYCFSIFLFSISLIQAGYSQPIIDDKFVGGPKDQNNGYEDPSKFVIASNDAMFMTCPNGVFGSASQGLGWTLLDSNTSGDFCFGPDSTLYLAGKNGVFASTNFGAKWSNLNAQLPNGPFSSVITTPDGTIMTGCPTGIFRSTDGGVNWDHIAQNEFPPSGSGAYLTVTLKGTVMARLGNTYYRSTDNGTTWTTSVPLTIQIWPVSTNNILREGNTGIERSTDDGLSWQSIPGLPTGNPYDVAMDPAGNLFAFFAWQLYISKDGGSTWSVVGTISGGGEELAFSQDHTLYFTQPSAGLWRTLKPLSSVPLKTESPALFLQAVNGPNSEPYVEFALPGPSEASLSLFNILGEKVSVLASGFFGGGAHTVSIPSHEPGGIYFCILQAGGASNVIKVALP